MNGEGFLWASLVLTLGGTALLVWSSWSAMRRAERATHTASDEQRPL